MDPVSSGLGDEGAVDVLGGFLGESEVMDLVTVVLGEADLDGRCGRDGAGEPDEGPSVRDLRHLAGDVVEVGLGDREAGDELLWRGWVALDVLLGESNTPDVERHRRFGLVDAVREFRRAAPDVEDEERSVGGVEVGGRAVERQAPLFEPGEQLGASADDRLDRVEELVSVGGVASSGRRGRSDPGDPVAVHDFAVLAKAGEDTVDRLVGEAAGALDVLSQPGDRHQPFDGALAVVDEQAGRVGTEVDGGDRISHGRGPLGDRFGSRSRRTARPPSGRRGRRPRRGARRSARGGT